MPNKTRTPGAWRRLNVETTLERSLETYFKNSIPTQACQRLLVSLKSPVPHLLDLNIPPSEAEKEVIKKAIKRTDSLIKTILVLELRLLPSDSHYRKDQKDKVRLALMAYQEVYHHDHEAVLMSLRRIPQEILGLIFMEAFNDDHVCIPTISQVCRLWRDVALSFSVLWSVLDVDVTKDKTWSKGFLASVDLQLRRSQNALLNVKLVMDWDFSAFHPALDKILDSSSRWITASLTVSRYSIPWLEKVNGKLTNLRKLFLRSTSSGNVGPTYPMFETAPALCEVQIDFPRHCTPPHVSLPWQQLVEYEETVNNPAKNITLMTSSRTLKVIWGLAAVIDTSPIVMKNLSVFHVDLTSSDSIGPLSRLRFPGIREFHVSSWFWQNLSPYLLSMLREQPILLQNLQIRQHPSTPGSVLIDLLRLTPYLKKLDLSIPTTSSDFNDLASFLSLPDSLPRLQTLILFSPGPYIQDPDNILKIVHGRCERSTQPEESESVGLKPPAVRSLMLQYWRHHNMLHADLEALNRKHRSPPLIECGEHEVPQKLSEWAKTLNDFLKRPSQKTKGLDELLSSLLKFEIEDVEHLYRTHIYLDLDRFVKQFGKTHDSRANEILQKWTDMLLLDLPNRRWARKGEDKLIYIPSNDSLRYTAPRQIIYGLPDDI